MNSKNLERKKKINAPENLEKFLIEFTVEVLLNNPSDLNEFAYYYFKSIYEKNIKGSHISRDSITEENVDFSSAYNESEKTKDHESNRMKNSNSVEGIQELTQRVDSSSLDDSSDELLELDWVFKKKSQSRRCSVFSKSYDPDQSEMDDRSYKFNETLEESDGEEAYEIVKNQPFEKSQTVKTQEQKLHLKHLLTSIVIFKYLNDDELDLIIDSMFEKHCEKDEVIIYEGESGYYFYVIISGIYEIFIKQKPFEKNDSPYGVKCSEYNDTGFFGELSLLYDQPRAATIISKEKGLLFCMNRDKFRKLIVSSSFERRKNYENFLHSLPLLTNSLTKYEISQVADSLIRREFKMGEIIFKQNDEADGMYFIEQGSVRIIKEIKDDEGIKSVEIRELCQGEFFGELALVNKVKRTASSYASEGLICRLAFLDLKAFERLIGPCRNFIQDQIGSYENEC